MAEAQISEVKPVDEQQQLRREAVRVMDALVNILPPLLENPDSRDEANIPLRQQLGGIVDRLKTNDPLRTAVDDRVRDDIHGIRNEINRVKNKPLMFPERPESVEGKERTLGNLHSQLEVRVATLAITETLGTAKA